MDLAYTFSIICHSLPLFYVVLDHTYTKTMGIVRQGLASPTQPKSKEDKNFDCSNTLPTVATDAFIEGASNELESKWYEAVEWDEADEVRATQELYTTQLELLAPFKDKYPKLAEWLERMEKF